MFTLIVGVVCVIVDILAVLGTRPTTPNPISSVLNKLHQNDFKLTYERTELARADPRYADCHFRTFKYNRTTPVTNGSCTLQVTLDYDARIVFETYRFASNEYREFPLRFEANFCEAVSSSAFGLNLLIENGNVVCPLVKAKRYYVNYFTPDPKEFPPLIPNGHYNLELQFWYQDKEMFAINNYGIVDRPIPIPDF